MAPALVAAQRRCAHPVHDTYTLRAIQTDYRRCVAFHPCQNLGFCFRVFPAMASRVVSPLVESRTQEVVRRAPFRTGAIVAMVRDALPPQWATSVPRARGQ
ncbi:hypothetical protein GCM10022207_85020 [Streptomyces lannensis]|uniref:Uncharacterized protein n=1 Tax=Streptomyces lannensis TaxID=766498 RepID=A0ABP7LJ08_9ACTN